MNNFKTGKNLFGISQYGSSGLYVDLTSNQSINGIKTFLSNLITNSNVNFNTTANIGRIVFKPNEPAGFGGNLVAIYTTDENDGQGWIFDADGKLYYIGTGFISQKIIFDPTGNIDAVGSITGGSLSVGTGTISTTGNISGGSLFCGSGPITGGAGSFTTGDFSSNVNITGATNGLTISGGFSGLFCNKIESQSGGAIVSSAVFNLRSALAVTNIILDPLNTIRLKINGITGTNSYLFFNNSNNLGFFNTSTGTNTWNITDLGAISGGIITASTSLNTNLIKAITTNTYQNLIQMTNLFYSASIGSIDFRSQYIGFAHPSVVLTSASKYFAIIPATDGNFTMSINNIASRVFFSNWSTLTLTSEFGISSTRTIQTTSNIIVGNGLSVTNGIIVNTGDINAFGNLEMLSTALVRSGLAYHNTIFPFSGTTVSCRENWNFLKSVGVNRILMFNTSTSNDIMHICRTGDNAYTDGYWFWNNTGSCGYIASSAVQWQIFPTGNINTSGALTCSSINVGGNIQTGTMNITGTANNSLILNYGGIHLQNNNWLFGRCKFGDADYAYVAEYDTGDSDKLYLFGSTGIYCNILPVVVSDKRLKENIKDFIINNPLEIIDKIRLVEYNRIDNPSKTKVLGYIAQEILEIFPKAVEIDQTVMKKDENSVLFKKHKDGTDSDEPEREERLALNYSYISMLNTEAIKQLNKKVDTQQTLIDTLMKRIEILENNVVINKE
jgi:hypothetical protein